MDKRCLLRMLGTWPASSQVVAEVHIAKEEIRGSQLVQAALIFLPFSPQTCFGHCQQQLSQHQWPVFAVHPHVRLWHTGSNKPIYFLSYLGRECCFDPRLSLSSFAGCLLPRPFSCKRGHSLVAHLLLVLVPHLQT